MDMVTTKEALKMLKERGLSVPYPTLALWVREGRFEGAELDESNPRGAVWYIPRRSIEKFQLPERGRPKSSSTETQATAKAGASNGTSKGRKKASKK
jgi:hypothetical protein